MSIKEKNRSVSPVEGFRAPPCLPVYLPWKRLWAIRKPATKVLAQSPLKTLEQTILSWAPFLHMGGSPTSGPCQGPSQKGAVLLWGPRKGTGFILHATPKLWGQGCYLEVVISRVIIISRISVLIRDL